MDMGKKLVVATGVSLAALTMGGEPTSLGALDSARAEQEKQVVTTQGRFYCNIRALTPAERARHKQMTEKLMSVRKEVVETELQLKDLESLEKKRERRLKDAKAPGKPGEEAKADLAVYDKLKAALEAGKPARSVPLDDDEKPRARELFLLTSKPVLYVANVDESQLATLDSDPLVAQVRRLAESEGARSVAICSKVEAEIQQLPVGERAEFLAHIGLAEPGLNKLAREGFALLGLQSYFTTGEDECRAWVIRKGTRAPQAAGVIHTDFERGFIKAEVIGWDELLRFGSEAAAKSKGAMRVEGKDYVVQDGDVVHFLFNV